MHISGHDAQPAPQPPLSSPTHTRARMAHPAHEFAHTWGTPHRLVEQVRVATEAHAAAEARASSQVRGMWPWRIALHYIACERCTLKAVCDRRKLSTPLPRILHAYHARHARRRAAEIFPLRRKQQQMLQGVRPRRVPRLSAGLKRRCEHKLCVLYKEHSAQHTPCTPTMIHCRGDVLCRIT
jgi:hypothetical protein